MKFNFLGGQHKGFSPNQNTQETVNMFLEVDSSEENKLTLYRVDGKKEYVVLKPDYPLSTIYVFPVGSGGVLTLSAVRPQVELNINDDVQDIYPPEWIRAIIR